MKTIILSAAAAATVAFGANTAFAEGHGSLQVVVPRGICPEMKQQLARWAVGKSQYTAFAVPTSLNPNVQCGDKGPRVTAGIATDPKRRVAQKAALEVCNQHRGDLGPCVVVGTVRNKR